MILGLLILQALEMLIAAIEASKYIVSIPLQWRKEL